MEEYRSFQVTLISALNLPDVRNHGAMKVYAKISTSRNSSGSERNTPVDKSRKTNPYWNFQFQCLIPEDVVRVEDKDEELVIQLYCDRSFGDRYVGEVRRSLKELFESGPARENVEWDVCGNDPKGTCGTLKLSYSFGESTQKISSTEGQSGSTGGGQRNGSGSGGFLQLVSGTADGLQIWDALCQGWESVHSFISGSEKEAENEVENGAENEVENELSNE